MYLNRYSIGNYSTGAPLWKQILWYFIGDRIVQSPLLPLSGLKVNVLRFFGAKIGRGTRLKNGIKVKFPWRLSIGNYSWIGENVWIDNLAEVNIGENVCISQGVYLCTGNHNWKSSKFDLITDEIMIHSSCWIGAKAIIGPGVNVAYGAILSIGSVATQNLKELYIHAGNPAYPIKERKLEIAAEET